MNNYRYDENRIYSEVEPSKFYQAELTHASIKHGQGWVCGGIFHFHKDTRPGSFHVNILTGAFTCFSCNAKGSNIIAFTIKRYALKYKEALKKLYLDWGL